MRKSYVIVYSNLLAGTHTAITEILDRLEPTCDWHVPMTNCVFFTSSFSAAELATHIEAALGVGPGKLYLITEASNNKQGRQMDRGWKLLNNPDNPRGT